METSEAKTIINVQGDYIAEQNNDIHDCTIYASGISPVVNKESISESSSGAKELSSMNSYPFVVYPKLAELGTYTAEEFEAAYRQAAAQGAPKFAKFLKHYSGLGIFDFEGNEKKQIFEILKAFFPSEIKYGYTNFTVYFYPQDIEFLLNQFNQKHLKIKHLFNSYLTRLILIWLRASDTAEVLFFFDLCFAFRNKPPYVEAF